ncbi:MAG: hypothetical protein KKD39_01730, partial [Candidatus Altiarchaeota archaeon]|nr:hypothetical protein [Candidatus Altiarchaeota archaeon]
LLVVFLVGDIQSLMRYGFTYDVARYIWWSSIFPIFFFIGANIVDDEKTNKLLFWILFIGVVAASTQHLYNVLFIRAVDPAYPLFQTLRTIAYNNSAGLILLMSCLLSGHDKGYGLYKKLIYYISLSLIIISFLMSLTRTAYIGIFLTMSLMFLCRGRFRWPSSKTVLTTFLVVGLLFVISYKINILGLAVQRLSLLNPFDDSVDFSSGRLDGFKTEINLWWDEGMLIWGIGATSPPEILAMYGSEEVGALNHVSLSGYLLHYGIIGFLLFGFVLPFYTFQTAKKQYFENTKIYSAVLALMVMAVAVYTLVTFFSSSLIIGARAHIIGLIYGMAWGLNYAEKSRKK